MFDSFVEHFNIVGYQYAEQILSINKSVLKLIYFKFLIQGFGIANPKMFDDLTQCLQLILKNMSNEHQNLSLVRSSVLVA